MPTTSNPETEMQAWARRLSNEFHHMLIALATRHGRQPTKENAVNAFMLLTDEKHVSIARQLLDKQRSQS